MTRKHILQTVLFSAAILLAVVLLDWLLNVVLMPGATPYTPWGTVAITLAVAPAATAFLVWQHARLEKAQTDLAAERAARLAEAERARDLAQAATRAKSQFLANMSHEIRTPLNGVLGMAQALDARPLDPEARSMVATIRESGVTLMAILNDVLDLSKIEAGRMDISSVDGQLMPLMQSVCELFRPRAEEKGLSFALTASPGLPESLCFDPVRVRQCVSNLVSNAVKFTRAGSVGIHVSAGPVGGDRTLVSIRVCDTGVGMDEAALSRLFQAFSQADESTTREFGGTGLGLAISRSLAVKMGGDIRATSAPGRGSEFVFSFMAEPARGPVQGNSGADSRRLPTPLRLRDARILLTDDNAINRQVARLFLQPQGASITEAANGQEALDRLAAEPFDLVLLDVHMPVMDGMQTIRAIRSSARPWSAVPVIALTADAMTGDRERLIAMGMSGYVSKPIDQSELLIEIGRVLGVAPVGVTRQPSHAEEAAAPLDRASRA